MTISHDSHLIVLSTTLSCLSSSVSSSHDLTNSSCDPSYIHIHTYIHTYIRSCMCIYIIHRKVFFIAYTSFQKCRNLILSDATTDDIRTDRQTDGHSPTSEHFSTWQSLSTQRPSSVQNGHTLLRLTYHIFHTAAQYMR